VAIRADGPANRAPNFPSSVGAISPWKAAGEVFHPDKPVISVIIPTFNGASRIGYCLDAVIQHTAGRSVEILVVNDGSTDGTADVVQQYSGVHLITQANAGPAAARNRGALATCGTIILFTDDDCVPTANWLDAMLEPFENPEVVGAKGVYRTRQKSLVARFVQIEYEDKYRLMARLSEIDFIDTYSAGFRRDRFLEMAGYDTSFPLACAEDVELSYRMSARGWKMKFAPNAIVYHTHPDTLSKYLKKKYKFAFWRVLAVRKNRSKIVKDSHTPQLMKLQLLFAPILLLTAALDLAVRPKVPTSAVVLAAFLISTLPFSLRAVKKDIVIGLLSPAMLAARACSQFLGVMGGFVYARRKPVAVNTSSPA
jgi:cellulose synthase/poly-beta-1,6-N-acetylglucosamine synthase-like glycosyltransferase